MRFHDGDFFAEPVHDIRAEQHDVLKFGRIRGLEDRFLCLLQQGDDFQRIVDLAAGDLIEVLITAVPQAAAGRNRCRYFIPVNRIENRLTGNCVADIAP